MTIHHSPPGTFIWIAVRVAAAAALHSHTRPDTQDARNASVVAVGRAPETSACRRLAGMTLLRMCGTAEPPRRPDLRRQRHRSRVTRIAALYGGGTQ